jgi:microcystin-dependent protein
MKKLLFITIFLTVISLSSKAQDEYIGVIKTFAGTYCPMGYMYCDGQTLQIVQYQALYAVIGNVYGGDGRTTFNLPDLRGRVLISAGSNGTTNYTLGQKGGVESIVPTPVIVATGRGATAAAASPNYNNVQPYLVVKYIICVEGLFPPRE